MHSFHNLKLQLIEIVIIFDFCNLYLQLIFKNLHTLFTYFEQFVATTCRKSFRLFKTKHFSGPLYMRPLGKFSQFVEVFIQSHSVCVVFIICSYNFCAVVSTVLCVHMFDNLYVQPLFVRKKFLQPCSVFIYIFVKATTCRIVLSSELCV